MKKEDIAILNQIHFGNHISREEVERAYIVLNYLTLTLDKSTKGRFKKATK
tara:strand:- start:71 stop:223 length:153 start_codon:yes stop_codon:yes gene_type:complete